jgi:hypothetical protein
MLDMFEAYSDGLRELKTIEVKHIRTLKDVANENPSQAGSIVEALRQHMLKVRSGRVPASRRAGRRCCARRAA